MNSKFFTNEDENTLKNKINHILTNDKNIEYLDFLIGYFRITGFDKIAENLSSIEHTRILIGINADKSTYEATQLIKVFADEQLTLCDEVCQNFLSMRELIANKKITIRIASDRDVHSKMYIMRSGARTKHDNSGTTYLGSVIIGSSNLTHNGLEKNTEINAELKDNSNVEDAVAVFERLWGESVELTEEDFEKYIKPHLKDPLPTQESITPYQFYIKLLIEHFGKRVDFLSDKGIFVPKEYKKLSYQVEAVNEGIFKLENHNGFFLSDVVGLGKTVVIAMLIKKLESTLKKRVLIVIPPAVRIQWEDTLNEFAIGCCDIVSLAKLGEIKSHKYEMVIVDESHKFKNKESQRYKHLTQICQNKKVILLSATPQNNTPSDLYAQIALFQNVKNSSIERCRDLYAFFDTKETEYKKIIESKTSIDAHALKTLSEEIRENVLKTIMIRRTRYDIGHHPMYTKDIDEQGLRMPTVQTPKEHEYTLEGELGIIFTDTAKDISEKLNYSRFNALHYLTQEARDKHYKGESPNIFDKNPLAGIMKTLLIKRFESSFDAFKISIERHLNRYAVFIANFEDDRVYLGKKSSDILDYDEESDGDYDVFIENLKEQSKIRVLSKKDFKETFLADLKQDYSVFEKLVADWKELKTDPKLDKFKALIKKEALAKEDKKIVVFTESVDTLDYLKREIDNKKILFITSQNREEMKQIIQENFDANYPLEKQKNNYNMIITTDTLAEGINLHRSNIIYNYDIPWNATKLIQRIGRVNRIGTKSDTIYIHNLKPASHIENHIALSQKAFVKLQSSHTMIGEDNQIYTKDEQIGSVNLFEEYKKEADERDETLDFLEELRTFREENPKVFEALKMLENPSVCRAGEAEQSYVGLEVNRDKRYLSCTEKEIKELSFVTMANALKADRDEKAIPYESIDTSKAIHFIEEEIKREKQDKLSGNIDKKSEGKALNFIEEWYQDDIIDEETMQRVEDIFNNGENILFGSKVLAMSSSPHKKEDLLKLLADFKPIPLQLEMSLEIKHILSQHIKKA